MDIDKIYSIVKFISNKNQQGYIAPAEFNNAFNLAQTQYFHQLVEDIQGWDANRKRIRLPMGNAEQAIQKVAPFIITTVIPVTPINGQLPKPGNLACLLALRTFNDDQRIWRVEHDRVVSHVASVIDPPSESPIYTEYSVYYKVSPDTIGSVNIDYLIYPPDAKWAYTTVSGRPVYDFGSSVQPLWGDTEITDIVIRVLFMFGISIQAPQLTQYYASVKTDGQ